jgi:hypothetical protein
MPSRPTSLRTLLSVGVVVFILLSHAEARGPDSYQADVPGAVERSLRNRLMDRLSVKDFGAVGDAVSDDTQALQAGAAWVREREGRALFLPSGTYRITAPIDFTAVSPDRARPVLLGDSQASTVIRVDFERSLERGAAFMFGDRRLHKRQRTTEISRLRFEYSKQTNTQPLFVDVYGAGQIEMNDIRFQSGRGQVARFTSVQNVRIDGLSVFGPVGKTYLYRDLQGPRRANSRVAISIGDPAIVSWMDHKGAPVIHGLRLGDPIRFSSRGPLPKGIVSGRTYFLKDVLSGTSFTISAVPEGAKISTAGRPGTGYTAWHSKFFFDLAAGEKTLRASGGAAFDTGFVGRRFVGVTADGTRHHFDVTRFIDATHIELDRALPAATTFLWGTIEGARLSMRKGSDEAISDAECFTGDPRDHVGRRIWITRKDDTSRMQPATILEVLAGNQVRLDWRAEEPVTLSPFMVPAIEFDTDPRLPGTNRSAPSVDVKVSNLYTSEYAGAFLAMKDIRQGRISNMKLESDSTLEGTDQPSAALLIDRFEGTIEGDLSAPSNGKARIIVAGQNAPLIVPLMIARIGDHEPQFLLQPFLDPNGIVVAGHLALLRGGSIDQPFYIDENSPSRFFHFGLAAVSGSMDGPRFNLGNISTYVGRDGTLYAPRITQAHSTSRISGGTLTIDLRQGAAFDVDNDANISTFKILNSQRHGVQTFTLKLKGSGRDSRQDWGPSVKWPNGVAPKLTTTAEKVDILTFTSSDGGGIWHGAVVGQNY